MNYYELSSKQVIDYLKREDVIGIGSYGLLYEYDYDTLIKLYYHKFISAYKSKRIRDFNQEMKINLDIRNFDFDFTSDKRIINLSNKLDSTSSKGLIKGIVTNRNYIIGILEEWYKDYYVLEDKFYNFSLEEKKYILEKIREKIFELFSVGIYPLDIKEDNILLNDNKDVKIIDLDGADVFVEGNDYINVTSTIDECKTRLYEMEYRLLREK